MSANIEQAPDLHAKSGEMKLLEEKAQALNLQNSNAVSQDSTKTSNEHPLHKYDLTVLSKFYETCVAKMSEHVPEWKANDWSKTSPAPAGQSMNNWPNPIVLSQKQRVIDAFTRLARESGEPMILMPNFDYGDVISFSRFLQALKNDGINAINKYKQYLSNKNIRKFEIDLVVLHAKYGVLLVEVKDYDHLDNKRRNRVKVQLNSALDCFEVMAKLIFDAKGWTSQEAHVPIMQFIALPNIHERPAALQSAYHLQAAGHNQSASSTVSNVSMRNSRSALEYLINSDLESSAHFSKWWQNHVAQVREEHAAHLVAEGKTNKFDVNVLNWMVGLINCIRNNLVMPVVYKEDGVEEVQVELKEKAEDKSNLSEDEKKKLEEEEEKQRQMQFQPALNVYGEFFSAEHEAVRAQPKVVVLSKEQDKLRKIICTQTLWLLLNDSQKKISVVCSEANKPYYEEFFARQRKLYSNLNNVRFFTSINSCTPNTQHTLKNGGETWFFDADINAEFSQVLERVKELNSFWVFSTNLEQNSQNTNSLGELNVKYMRLDEIKNDPRMSWTSHDGKPLTRFPMRIQCDLLIIGDIVHPMQTKLAQMYMKVNTVTNYANLYTNSHALQQQHHIDTQRLGFNPVKKFKTIKFIRGGAIDNLRNALKMHDSIQANCVLMHIGDEDLFKTRNSMAVAERIKEMSTLVKEYCPKSFVLVSTLMRRLSRTENSVTNEVNKGIINFCKQTRDVYYLLNNYFEPDYHTQEGRVLKKKGLRLYMENFLFAYDYFYLKNNKQH